MKKYIESISEVHSSHLEGYIYAFNRFSPETKIKDIIKYLRAEIKIRRKKEKANRIKQEKSVIGKIFRIAYSSDHIEWLKIDKVKVYGDDSDIQLLEGMNLSYYKGTYKETPLSKSHKTFGSFECGKRTEINKKEYNRIKAVFRKFKKELNKKR